MNDRGKLLKISLILAGALLIRLVIFRFLGEQYSNPVRIAAVTIILSLGAGFVLLGCAKIIEETTGVLSERTKLAGGLLQSLGTAFPDMVLGVVAALVSLSVRNTNYQLAINYAIIAAATTFGSNIYNVGHAIYCLSRQMRSNLSSRPILMFPPFSAGGSLTPLKDQPAKPSIEEMDTAISVINALSFLTALIALCMVIFGRVANTPQNFSGELYQLTKPAGLVMFAFCLFVLFRFRKRRRSETTVTQITEEENYYRERPGYVLWTSLIISGVAILLTAESMVFALRVISEIGHIPFMVTGILAGVVGCLGEMIVVHNFSVHPNGRIGDAVVGVAMDNVVTILGASLVAIIGGIFLGGRDLIILFVVILALNTILINEVSKMKTALFTLVKSPV